jgi:hypothetical protein
MLQQNTAVYGPNIRYVDLTITQLTASANAPIRVVAFNWAAKITTREQNTHPVAFWSGNDTSNFITYVQNFKTPCNIPNGNSVPVTLRWFDADWGAPPQGLNVFTMFLVNDTTGVHVTPPGGLRSDSYPFGGDNAYGTYNVSIIAGHRYRWIWSGIQKNNGLQVFMPFSEILYGINCPPPPTPPTCAFSAPVAIAGGFRLNWTSRNATSAAIDQGIGTVGIAGPRDVGATSRTYTMTVRGPGGTATCSTTTSLPPALPTCESVTLLRNGTEDTSVPAGDTFASQVTIKNSRTTPVTVSDATYKILSAPAVSDYTINTTGSSTARPTIGANSDESYESAEDIRIGVPGTYTVEWTLVTDAGNIKCTGDVNFTVEALVCTVTTIKNSLGTPEPLKIALENKNYIPISITGSKWEATNTNPASGFGVIDTNNVTLDNTTGGGSTVGAGSTTGPTSLTISSANISTSATGEKRVSWVISTAYSAANPSGCENNAGIIVRSYPYTRFYGNDVFAGGGFGTCAITTGVDVRGNGAFTTAPGSHANYIGAASELAVFASGQIDGVLPGSQDATRSPLEALGFANDSPDSGTYGGKFNSPLCADNFLAVDTSGFSGVPDEPTGKKLNLQGASKGNYAETTVNSKVELTGADIRDNKRIQLFVNGDIVITSNIIYGNANDGTWSVIGDIPLVRVYATGDIFIDDGVTELSGLFVAGGTIHTCSNGNTAYNIVSDASLIAANCNSKLTVYGAFIANSVELLRVKGSVGTSTAQEGGGSDNIAEAFIFSPELYLALLSEGSANTGAKFDSILSLPPAF